MTYYDTGVLVKLYVPEAGSPAVQAFVSGRGLAISLNELQDCEARNAFSLKAVRREMTRAELASLCRKWDQDARQGRLLRRSLPWPEVFQRGAALSEAHSAEMGCRTLDVLHVAAALVLRATEFVTFDMRQRRLAVAAGLDAVVPGQEA
jgi:predicted nucleic acid-binding protein